MRNAFADELLQLAREDSRIVLLSGDIGNRLFDNYKAEFGERFFNCGVAEANMMGVAAGMALSGLRPIVYTITPFTTTRCMEQIRVDVCYHNAPVIIVGVGSGLSYANNGATHHSCEDVAMLRTLPGMTIVCPGDAMELRSAMHGAVAINGPLYLRIGKKGEPVVHSAPPRLEIGKTLKLADGKDIALLSTGNMLPVAAEVSQMLAKAGFSARLDSFHTVKPLDEIALRDIFPSFELVVTVEEHSRIGGLGGAVAEWLANQEPLPGRLLRVGVPDRFMDEAGEQEHARKYFQLDAASVYRQIMNAQLAVKSKRPFQYE